MPRAFHLPLKILLVGDQNPDDILSKVRSHLHRRGFDDVKMTKATGFLVQAPRTHQALSYGNACEKRERPIKKLDNAKVNLQIRTSLEVNYSVFLLISTIGK